MMFKVLPNSLFPKSHQYLHGHAMVTDITNGNNTVVAKDIWSDMLWMKMSITKA